MTQSWQDQFSVMLDQFTFTMMFRHNLIFRVLPTKESKYLSHKQAIFYIIPGFWKQYIKMMILKKSKHQLQVIKQKMQDGFFPLCLHQRDMQKHQSSRALERLFYLLLKHQLVSVVKGMIPDCIQHNKPCVPLVWK